MFRRRKRYKPGEFVVFRGRQAIVVSATGRGGCRVLVSGEVGMRDASSEDLKPITLRRLLRWR